MQLVLRRPDDWHLHLRDGEMLAAVAPHSRAFGRVIAMPNLSPPITTVAAAAAYRERIEAAGLRPLMTCYLTDRADPGELARGFCEGVWVAAKLYPAKATTNSEHGVTDVAQVMAALERMAEIGMPLLVHGEVTDPDVDVFDREAAFLDRVLGPLCARLPSLKVVLEHATTREAVAFVQSAPRHVAATLTPHHLWWNRNALFDGGLRPHAYCLPVLKRERDRLALRAAATSGDPRFFAGTDSAPHAVARKEQDCGCAGVFCAPTALAAYAQVFEDEGALDRLEGFLSLHGAAFYGLPPSEERVALLREPWTPPVVVPAAEGGVRVFLGGEVLRWRVA